MDGSPRGRAAGRDAGRLGLIVLPALLALVGVRLAFDPVAVAARPLADSAPAVLATNPSPAARDVPLTAARDGSLAVTFSEPVVLADGGLELACERSQVHVLAAGGGPTTFTFVSDRPFLPGETCQARVPAGAVADLDGDDPPNNPQGDVTWSFQTVSVPVVLNELDASTPGGMADFIELYDGGRGQTDLSELTLVLYRGDEATVYLAVGLDGYQTDSAGYFVLGASGVPEAHLRLATDTLRDGPDAVAIYDAPESAFPRNAPVSVDHLLDAAVYGPADEALLVLLEPGEEPLDEAARGTAASDSNQRCPNGGGRPRESGSFVQNHPTPGQANGCRFDAAPEVVRASPAPGELDVALEATIEVVFSEPVRLGEGALELACTHSGPHAYSLLGEGQTFRFQPVAPFVAAETCSISIDALRVADEDADDPPDHLANDLDWTFQTIAPVAEHVAINEVDADTPGVDKAEFIELYDGGAGRTALDGLVIALFNGTDDRSYLAVSLDGVATDENGYFLLANPGVAGVGVELANGILQNGPDAVALVAGDAADFPNGTTVSSIAPVDAVVYSSPTANDAGLQPLLNTNQPQVDENGRGAADAHSNQRCPNGAGGARNTTGIKQNSPTPGSANDCVTDAAPAVIGMNPGRGEIGVSIFTPIAVEFDEPVSVTGAWVTLKCTASDTHAYKTSGGPTTFTIEPDDPLAHAENCAVTVNADRVTDIDTDDPPDAMARKVTWSFTTAEPPADFILINEIDPDTPGTDTAELIELFDGGAGQTKLDGLVLVLFNGSTSRSYRSIDLDGYSTNAQGYFLIGNAPLTPDLLITDGTLQNGPDAAALYAADAAQFPNDSSIRVQGLIDAVVYGDDDAATGLLDLLAAGQRAADENGRGAADAHSLQRCPNGSGGPRQTAAYSPNLPTPDAANHCRMDDAPYVTVVSPLNGATGISVHAGLTLGFSEPVQLATGTPGLSCVPGGERPLSITGGPDVFALKPAQPLPHEAVCRVQVHAADVSDTDPDDPPDQMVTDYEWSFRTAPPPPDFILINEVDADTPGNDRAEFIELYDGGVGNTDLTGLLIVLYNGGDDRTYHVADLAGTTTDAAGYLVIGNSGVTDTAVVLPNGVLQNGADAVALYAGDTAGFPQGTALHTRGLLDAVVYGTADPADSGLLALLYEGEPQIDEAGSGAADRHSSGRCPNGVGGQRRTGAYSPGPPTPHAPNNCPADEAPAVAEVEPGDGATGIALDPVIKVTFTEAVVVSPGWFAIVCDRSGNHPAEVGGDSIRLTITPADPFWPGERCAITLHADAIADADENDPPDQPLRDFNWSFTTAVPPAAFILINEIDIDTPGPDKAELIELYDGGLGQTSLDGLVVVLWNGQDDRVYRAIGLADHQTNANGTFVLGNAGIEGVDLVLANGTLQNGPDAVAIYAGHESDFPTGTPLKVDGLIDAVVYGPADQWDAGLLGLLDIDQPQVDEDSRGAADIHSLQRCPNGAGGPRRTAAFWADGPSPGKTNPCVVDDPPRVVGTFPPAEATDVAIGATIHITLSEAVETRPGWFHIACESSGDHTATVTGGPVVFALAPDLPLAEEESCTIVVVAEAVHDLDLDDPPDSPDADYEWAFRTGAAKPPPPVAGFTSNAPLWVGETAVFANTSSGSGPLDFVWEFGDGSPPVTDVHPAHRYGSPGVYQVVLTVTGPSGTTAHDETILVRPRRLYLGLVVK